MNSKPIRPIPINTTCCLGHREFTFYGESLAIESTPVDYAILNATASNYIHGEVQTLNLHSMIVTIPSLSSYLLDEKSVQVIGTILGSTQVNVQYSGNTTMLIHPTNIDLLKGIFTIRIWIDNLTPA